MRSVSNEYFETYNMEYFGALKVPFQALSKSVLLFLITRAMK
jgi:hypothetical protein